MQNVAFVLIGLGILALVGWSIPVFFMESAIPLVVRIAVGVVGVGILILIGIAIRDRLTKDKGDDFKEVER